MENLQMEEMIKSFLEYQKLLSPIQQNIQEFLDTYSTVKQDMDKLNTALSGEIRSKLNDIYTNLSNQGEKSSLLTKKVDEFLQSSSKYTNELQKLLTVFSNVENKVITMSKMEEKVEELINNLSELIDEKKNSYNINQLQKSLESYNKNLTVVGEFINKDVAQSVLNNGKSLQEIKDGNNLLVKQLEEEKSTLKQLAEDYKTNSNFIKSIVEKDAVNQDYLYEVLDKWAESRKVKTKK